MENKKELNLQNAVEIGMLSLQVAIDRRRSYLKDTRTQIEVFDSPNDYGGELDFLRDLENTITVQIEKLEKILELVNQEDNEKGKVVLLLTSLAVA